MSMQVCPKCNGQGIVAKPAWIPGDVRTWNGHTTAPYRCNLCDGAKVIHDHWEPAEKIRVAENSDPIEYVKP